MSSQLTRGSADYGSTESVSTPAASVTPTATPFTREGTTVRWLAELCGVAPPGTALPYLFTELLDGKEQAAVQRYIAWWMRHADAGSSFDTLLKPISSVSDEELIQILRQRNYDGLCYFFDGKIAGHVFFQKHATEMCAFSAAVDPLFRGQKLGSLICLDFVAHASQLPGIRRVSVGTGRNPITRTLIELLARHARTLGWRAKPDGWVDFGNKTP